MRSILVVTGSRAEYGLLREIMRKIAAEPSLNLMIAATGMSLDAAFGATYKEIEADGFTLHATVPIHEDDDTPVGTARAIAVGIAGFAETFVRLRPNVVLVVGDRFEIFAAVAAAATLGIPVAHLHGGETTEGSVDEMYRHAITKMSYFHFPASDLFARRIIRMGEMPERVVNVGAPGLEAAATITPMSKEELEGNLGFIFTPPVLMITYHPVTLADGGRAEAVFALFDALDRFPDARLIFTLPNADAGGRRIAGLVKEYVERNRGRAVLFASLGQRRYFSALRLVDAVVGNSSSGLIEAPAFGVPTINIGDRQKGRPRTASVIDCGESAEAITEALKRALSPSFRKLAHAAQQPYDMKETSLLVAQVLRDYPVPAVGAKTFYDGDGEP